MQKYERISIYASSRRQPSTSKQLKEAVEGIQHAVADDVIDRVRPDRSDEIVENNEDKEDAGDGNIK